MNDDFVSRLLLAIHGISVHDLGTPEAEGKWSILDVIAHLGDFEQLTQWRLRLVLGEDTSQLAQFDQQMLVATHRGERLSDLVEQLAFARRMNLTLAARLTPEERGRVGVHPNFGPLTINEMLDRAQRHQERHFAQIERIRKNLGLAVSELPQTGGAESGHARDAAIRMFGEVRVRDLWNDGVKRALQVEFPAGSQWPCLDHHVPGPEEVFVVSGDFEDNGTVYGPGTFLHYPAGSSHSPRSTEGCTLFVFYPEG
jgi:quercetin dioxygenase-like cupin family protein